MHAEIADRRRDLLRASESLTEAKTQWSAHLGKIAVADTNIYLHHQQLFDEVEWGSLLQTAENEPVQLVIPILVVDELDRAKRGRNETRSRARETLRRLTAIFDDPYRPAPLTANIRTTAHLLLNAAGHQRLTDADSELIDRTLALSALTASPVAVVTFDTGMALRARAAGLEVRHLVDA